MPFDPQELSDHFNKHGREFSASTDKDYEAMADQFSTMPRHVKMLECKRIQGDLVRYDTLTDEFVVVSRAGFIRTYFKAVPCSSLPPRAPRLNCHNEIDNQTYFRKECARRW